MTTILVVEDEPLINQAVGDLRGEVTPELHAAWADPVVRAAHLYELGAVTVVLVLMLAKPF